MSKFSTSACLFLFADFYIHMISASYQVSHCVELQKLNTNFSSKISEKLQCISHFLKHLYLKFKFRLSEIEKPFPYISEINLDNPFNSLPLCTDQIFFPFFVQYLVLPEILQALYSSLMQQTPFQFLPIFTIFSDFVPHNIYFRYKNSIF